MLKHRGGCEGDQTATTKKSNLDTLPNTFAKHLSPRALLGMHAAPLHPGLHHCCTLHTSAVQIYTTLGQPAGLSETRDHRLSLGHQRLRYSSWLTCGQRHRALTSLHQSLLPPGNRWTPGKAGKGQVSPRYRQHGTIYTCLRVVRLLQLCIRCCEPHSYHERPHMYANNPPTPGLRLALGTDAAKAVQGQRPDHPKALDAL